MPGLPCEPLQSLAVGTSDKSSPHAPRKAADNTFTDCLAKVATHSEHRRALVPFDAVKVDVVTPADAVRGRAQDLLVVLDVGPA